MKYINLNNLTVSLNATIADSIPIPNIFVHNANGHMQVKNAHSIWEKSEILNGRAQRLHCSSYGNESVWHEQHKVR